MRNLVSAFVATFITLVIFVAFAIVDVVTSLPEVEAGDAYARSSPMAPFVAAVLVFIFWCFTLVQARRRLPNYLLAVMLCFIVVSLPAAIFAVVYSVSDGESLHSISEVIGWVNAVVLFSAFLIPGALAQTWLLRRHN